MERPVMQLNFCSAKPFKMSKQIHNHSLIKLIYSHIKFMYKMSIREFGKLTLNSFIEFVQFKNQYKAV